MVGCRRHVGRLSMIYRCSKSFSVSVVSLLKRQLSCLIHRQLASARSSELFRRFPASTKVTLNRVVQGYSRRLIWGGEKFVIREKSSMLVVIRELIASPGARFSKLPKLSRSISGAIISFVSQRRRRVRSEILQQVCPFVSWNHSKRSAF